MTGVADANMDRAPLVAIAGQGATTRMHKESHQILDLVNLFDPITKYSTQIRTPEVIPEIVRKAFKTAQTEKPGACFIDFPENIAGAEAAADAVPLKVQYPAIPTAPAGKCAQVADIISKAKAPVIMAGNGVIRERASEALIDFAEKLNVPVATTFMAKGVIPFSHPLCLGAIGLQARDYVAFGFDEADLIICIGVDMVEYHPRLWNPKRDKKIIHIDQSPAEVDAHYILEAGVVGEISDSLGPHRREGAAPRRCGGHKLHEIIRREIGEFRDDDGLPGQAAEDHLGSAPGARQGGHRHLRRRRPQDVDRADVPGRGAQHLHHLEWLRRDGHRAARRHRRQARLSRIASAWRSAATPAS